MIRLKRSDDFRFFQVFASGEHGGGDVYQVENLSE
jgi:hypothetical protein